jgi:hypothetical protein
VTWECPPEDKALVEELVEIMKKFQNMTYDRKEMTLHTQLLGCISPLSLFITKQFSHCKSIITNYNPFY